MNTKRELSKFENLIFAGLTFFGFIFVFIGVVKSESLNGNGGISSISVTGIILMLGFPFYLIKTKIFNIKVTEKEADRIRKLKTRGEKIIVDLSKLDIRSSGFNQISESPNWNNRRNKNNEKDFSEIIINLPHKNELIEYKIVTNIKISKLKTLFTIEEETEFYISYTNPKDNYLDLNFLYRLSNVEHLKKVHSELLKFRNKIDNEQNNKNTEDFIVNIIIPLNYLLYELDVCIESEIFDEELVLKCEEILQANKVQKKRVTRPCIIHC